MHMANATQEAYYSQLTVPQLRALCKEKKIVGYSKLGKAALIEKLVSQSKSGPVSVSSGATSTTKLAGMSEAINLVDTRPEIQKQDYSGNAPASGNHVKKLQAAQTISTSRVLASRRSELNGTHLLTGTSPFTMATASNQRNTELAVENVSHESPRSHLSQMVGFNSSVQPFPPPTGIIASLKRAQCTLDPQPDKGSKKPKALRSLEEITTEKEEDLIGRVETVQTSRSNVPVGKEANYSSRAQITKYPQYYIQKNPGTSVSLLSITAPRKPSRFKPLKVSLRPSNGRDPFTSSADEYQRNSLVPVIESAYLDFNSAPVVPLKPISFPPTLGQRKYVQPLSVILSSLEDRERRQCLKASRAIRYSAHLSAAHLIRSEFGDQLHSALSQLYNFSMTDCWPYLLCLRMERSRRLQVYRASFLPRFFGEWNPICNRLWGSPEGNQLSIALRFIITRLWFTTSVGGRDRYMLKRSVVTALEEIVKDEIWRVYVTTYGSTDTSFTQQVFYVLEPSCEVIGLPSPSKAPRAKSVLSEFTAPAYSLSLRVDWSEYIRYRYLPSDFHESRPPSLLSRLKWTNTEEYEKGISKLWLSKISGEGNIGSYMKKVAERYIVSCVVGNSVSGHWMSSSHMAQVFAGKSSSEISRASRKKEMPRVNLFLPAHHLVESVHFTTSRKESLHPALAVIQTPGREYFVLRDNGMEVGCEEDGVWPPWMELLECNEKGLRIH